MAYPSRKGSWLYKHSNQITDKFSFYYYKSCTMKANFATFYERILLLPIPAAPSQEAVLFRVMRKRSMIDYDLPAAKVSIKLNAPQLNSPRRFWAITATAYITKFYFLIQTLWTCKKFPVYTTPKELWLPTLNVNISIALCSKNSSSITAWGDREAIILVDNSCLFEGIK